MKTTQNITFFLLSFFVICLIVKTNAQDVFKDQRQDWLRKAEEHKPVLIRTEVSPKEIVSIVEDENAFQGLRAVPASSMSSYYGASLQDNSGKVIDFGDHLVGYLSLSLKPTSAADAPIRIKLTMGESPAEVFIPFETTDKKDANLGLSKAWFQEEVVTVDEMPGVLSLPRRYSFRYLKIELLAYSPRFDVVIDKVSCVTTSSADYDNYTSGQAIPDEFKEINRVSIKTLRDCMQTVFEDGPKRDRRIWIGDLKLQALANYYSFNNSDLVRRGLYLFAATASESGLLNGTLFERPFIHPERQHPLDYCLLYNTILSDFYEATGDITTIRDLWPVAKQQVLLTIPQIREDGLLDVPDNWWFFVDWNEQLDKEAALHGIVIHAFQKTLELAKIVNKEEELSMLPTVIRKLRKAADKHYYDKSIKLFVSGEERQISVGSQVWMILSRVVPESKGKELLQRMEDNRDLVKPVSPYMYHYLLESMIQCGMYNEAKALIQDYWGGMISKGAETFWEVYDPEDDFLTPYNSYLLNSYCHAWSCTPVYFIRKYGEKLFQYD
jgi:hypothetical protein